MIEMPDMIFRVWGLASGDGRLYDSFPRFVMGR